MKMKKSKIKIELLDKSINSCMGIVYVNDKELLKYSLDYKISHKKLDVIESEERIKNVDYKFYDLKGEEAYPIESVKKELISYIIDFSLFLIYCSHRELHKMSTDGMTLGTSLMRLECKEESRLTISYETKLTADLEKLLK